jgi:hypothetical protein
MKILIEIQKTYDHKFSQLSALSFSKITQENGIPSSVKSIIDSQLAKFITVSGISFQKATEPVFTRLLQLLSHNYKPVCIKTLKKILQKDADSIYPLRILDESPQYVSLMMDIATQCCNTYI